MRIAMKALRSTLVEYRIFVMGQGVATIEDSGSSYRDEVGVNIQSGIVMEPYSMYWSGSATQMVTMGAFSYVHSRMHPSVSIGRYTSIAAGVHVMGNNHPSERASTSPTFYKNGPMMRAYQKDIGKATTFDHFDEKIAPITIGNDVWIGENVTLAHGISIGDGAVVAANAVVTKDVEPYAVMGGVPARKIKDRFSHAIIAKLQDLEWWRYSPDSLSGLDFKDLPYFCDKLAELIESGSVAPYRPEKVLTYARLQELYG